MKILITNKNDFIIEHLIKKYRQDNEFIFLDSIENLSSLFDKHKFDVCVHNLSMDNVQDSIDNPKKNYELNLDFTHKLLMQCKIHKIKIIYLSSWMVYESTNKNISEDSKLNPNSPYATSKLSAEFLIKSFGSAFDVKFVILRMFNCYGPGKTYGVVYHFLKNKTSNKPLLLYGDGLQSRDFIYVEDAVNAIYLAIESHIAINNIINIGTGRDLSMKELANSITDDIEYRQHLHQKSEVLRVVCDNNKAKEILNWEPKISLSEGLLKTKRWLEDEFT